MRELCALCAKGIGTTVTADRITPALVRQLRGHLMHCGEPTGVLIGRATEAAIREAAAAGLLDGKPILEIVAARVS